jgi:hypothetical protein
MMSEENIITIKAIQIEDGFFATDSLTPSRYNNGTSLSSLRINGESPEKTFDKSWVYLFSKPLCVERFVPGQLVNKRYELKDPEMASDHIPLVLPKDEVIECCDYECEWKEEYAHLQSLYEFKEDKEKDSWDEVPFSFEVVMQADTSSGGTPFSYPIQRGQWKADGFVTCTEQDVINQGIDRILWPPVLLKDKPSKLSSDNTYKIIRKHVQDNINPRVAVITSDYDFCFTVKKKINREKSPYRRDRNVEVFEMTNASKKYRGYTVIQGFEGKSHKDLKDNIDTFLDDLMNKINEPLVECPHCSGVGVVGKNN